MTDHALVLPLRRTTRALPSVAGSIALCAVIAAAGGCGSDDAPKAAAPAGVAVTEASGRPGSSGPVTAPSAPTSVPSTSHAPGTSTTSGPTTPPADAGAPVTVDPDSVSVDTTGPWRALGLVRAAPGATAYTVREVRAELRAGGRVLGVVSAAPAVSIVPAGGDVPFVVVADDSIDPGAVTDIEWVVAAEPTPTAPPALDVAAFWERPAGQARPLDVPGFRDDPVGPFPHVLYGSVTAVGPAAVADPGVVGAWIGAQGAVLAVAAAPALRPGTAEPASSAEPGVALDAVLVVRDPVRGVGLDGAAARLWGTAR